MDDAKYYGMYRGVVVDNADPLDRGRVKVIVPQVSGEAVTDWAWPVGGNLSQYMYPYGTFTTTVDQYPSGANTAKIITHETVEDSNQIFVDGSRIYVEQSGDYFIQYSTTFAINSSNAQTVDVWFKLNGQNIPRSNTKFILSGNPNQRNVTKGGVIDLQAGDYLELAFAATDVNVHVASDPATSVHPLSAGSVFSIHLAGKFKPKPETAVWVSFEGGDPNFPLWIGVC